MATKRIAQSSIDWLVFAEKVPKNQKMMFQAFKSKSDLYLNKVLTVPENPPKIDWAMYRGRGVTSALVDQFEKEYNAVKIPYPQQNVMSEIETQEKQAETEIAQFVKSSQATVGRLKSEVEKWQKMVPFEHMTMDDFRDTFPELALDPIKKPTYWPHNPEEQIGYDDGSEKGGHH